MDQWLGAFADELFWAAIIAALLVMGLVAIGMRSRGKTMSTAIRRRSAAAAPAAVAKQDAPHAGPYGTGRLTVLDTIVVDENRRLVLIRRDRIEHLLLIGGPTDVVVESQIPIGDAVAGAASRHAVADAVTPGTHIKPQLAARFPVAEQSGRAVPDESATDDESEEPEAAEASAPPREPAIVRPAPDKARRERQPRPAASHRQEPSLDRRAVADISAGADDGDLDVEAAPAARIEPLMPLGEPLRAAAVGGSAKRLAAVSPDSATTLGDLAERLEEALAREVRTNQRHDDLELDLDEFEFSLDEAQEEEEEQEDVRPIRAETRPRPVQQDRPAQVAPVLDVRPGGPRAVPRNPEPSRAPARAAAPRLQDARPSEIRQTEMRPGDQRPGTERARDERVRAVERPAIPASPEVEPRQETRARADRQDDLPVINLSSRRRDNPDPLEDEMARLLGELTGDEARR